MRLPTLTILIIILFFVACKTTNKKVRGSSNLTIPEKTMISLKIISIDSVTDDIYDFVRFYHRNSKTIGIILNKRSAIEKYKINQKIRVKLCDVQVWLDLYRTKDTNSLGPSVQVFDFSKQGESAYIGETILKDKDTIRSWGHAMPDRIEFENSVFLDFSDSAIEPVFEICKE